MVCSYAGWVSVGTDVTAALSATSADVHESASGSTNGHQLLVKRPYAKGLRDESANNRLLTILDAKPNAIWISAKRCTAISTFGLTAMTSA
jgi:hypothetical protein